MTAEGEKIMPKRSTPNLRNQTEQRLDNYKHYGICLSDNKKGVSRINPIFTEKPHYGLEKAIQSSTDVH